MTLFPDGEVWSEILFLKKFTDIADCIQVTTILHLQTTIK